MVNKITVSKLPEKALNRPTLTQTDVNQRKSKIYQLIHCKLKKRKYFCSPIIIRTCRLYNKLIYMLIDEVINMPDVNNGIFGM